VHNSPEISSYAAGLYLTALREVFYQCWQEEVVPRDKREATDITLFSVFLIRLQQLAERVHPESKCSFGVERSTVGMVFSLRQLQEE